jgi:hypothetical protein
MPVLFASINFFYFCFKQRLKEVYDSREAQIQMLERKMKIECQKGNPIELSLETIVHIIPLGEDHGMVNLYSSALGGQSLD